LDKQSGPNAIGLYFGSDKNLGGDGSWKRPPGRSGGRSATVIILLMMPIKFTCAGYLSRNIGSGYVKHINFLKLDGLWENKIFLLSNHIDTNGDNHVRI
jgi:hypothetical protein